MIDRHKGNTPIDYLFFWGHTAKVGQAMGAWCMSQWWVAPFEVDGVVYKTAEHWMMAEKARLFKDEDALKVILATETPIDAKAGGRLVKGFDPAAWDERKFEIVVEGNQHKFGQHEVLKEYLLGTGDRVLVEASPRDTIWGIGMGGSNPLATDPEQWRGENLLGFVLMEVRDKLKRH